VRGFVWLAAFGTLRMLARLVSVRAPRVCDGRAGGVPDDRAGDEADRPEHEAARERAERGLTDAFVRACRRCERKHDGDRRNERFHRAPSPKARSTMGAKWGVSGERPWPRRGDLRFLI